MEDDLWTVMPPDSIALIVIRSSRATQRLQNTTFSSIDIHTLTSQGAQQQQYHANAAAAWLAHH
jgi:hypothetical protein